MSLTLVLGYIQEAHGIKGAVKLLWFSGEARVLSPGTLVQLSKNGVSTTALEVEKASPYAKERGIVKFIGIEDRTKAETLVGLTAAVPSGSLPPLDEGEYYVEELVGSSVVFPSDASSQNLSFGILRAVGTSPAHDIYHIEIEAKEILIPAVREFIASINPAKKEIYLTEAGRNYCNSYEI